jgi:tetratricopeptide (TPR) repeat protein
MTASAYRVALRLCALLILLPIALQPGVLSAQPRDQQLTTQYFTIYYPYGEEKTAEWYAGFADDVYVAVSELLGAEPVGGLVLNIYATEAQYSQANPIAETHPGVMAHAIPELREIGVAVERLRKEAPELARESFRHEMTHIVAGAVSYQRLPIGFQEGLAQYNELSSSRAQEVVQAVQAAQTAGEPLLSLREMNSRRVFRQRLDLAYPQSYTVMAFLAEEYGMGAFAQFLVELRDTRDWRDAFVYSYGVPIEQLEAEWQAFLPGFLKDGWRLNVLSAYDLSPGIALYESGRFTEAKEHFARSERLLRELGKLTRAGEAADQLAKADKAVRAAASTDKAREQLLAHDYAASLRNARDATTAFTDLELQDQRTRAEEVASFAARGVEALSGLERARTYLGVFNLPGAREEARRAAEEFAQLGDANRLEEANQIMSSMTGWQRLAGVLALAAGCLTVGVGMFATLRSRRRKYSPQPAVVTLREENASWL